MAFHRIFLAATYLLFVAGASGAAEYPRVLFPSGQAPVPDGSGMLAVDEAMLQIEIQPGVVVSAERGTRLLARPVGGSPGVLDLYIEHGSPTVIDTRTNAMVRVPPGRYRIDALHDSMAMLGAGTAPNDGAGFLPGANDGLSPGYRLSDSIMTQQQKYLDSLKIDVRDINNVLASIIRSLVPRRP
jgi:hypothetical protein